MPRFRKRPIEIEARRFDGAVLEQAAMLKRGRTALEAWCGGTILGGAPSPTLRIPTLEGAMDASLGDWIICGVKGEFYPIKPDIFEATYERVEEVG